MHACACMHVQVRLLTLVETSRYFIFVSVFEYALVNWLMRLERGIEAATAEVDAAIEEEAQNALQQAVAAAAEAATAEAVTASWPPATTKPPQETVATLEPEPTDEPTAEPQRLLVSVPEPTAEPTPSHATAPEAATQAVTLTIWSRAAASSSSRAQTIMQSTIQSITQRITQRVTQSTREQDVDQSRKGRPNRRELIKQRLSRSSVGRLLLSPHGTMRIRAQHLDVAARYAYPVAYSAVVGLYYGVPTGAWDERWP